MTKKIKEVKVETESGKIITSQDQLKSFLKNNKDSHYNFEESVEYKISSGSLLLDYFLNGGIGTGLHRFCGINEGGKTSCALQFMKNFLDQPKKRKGFYIKAEGRLSNEMMERSGIKFVFSASEAYLVENGNIKQPLKGATLIGNGPDAMSKISMIGNDLALDDGIGTCGKDGQGVPVGVGQPTLLMGGITIGGTDTN